MNSDERDNTNREALELCPFCGGPAEKRLTDGPKRGFIGCFTCMIGLPFNMPYGDAEVAAWNARVAAALRPPMCAVHAALDRKDTLVLEVGNDCVACSLHERTALLSLLEPFAAEDGSQDSLTVLRGIIASAASVAAPQGDADGISWTALLSCLERLRSKNRNPDADWYNGWNAAIQCLINDINSRATSSPVSPSPTPEQKAHYETAHEARYTMSHAVHPDIVVLWFLAMKSHWFDDPKNMFFGMREQAKAYLYKWVETGELADDNTTLEIATAMKFREWLASSWTAVPSQPSARVAADTFDDLIPLTAERVAPGEYEIKARDGRRLWIMDGAALAEWVCESTNRSIVPFVQPVEEQKGGVNISFGPSITDAASGGTCPRCGGSIPTCCRCPIPCPQCSHIGMMVNGFCRAVINDYGPQAERRVCGCACFSTKQGHRLTPV